MRDSRNKILERIKEIDIPCPDCEDFYGDDQYTCETCYCEGGQGKINSYEWLKDNNYLKEEEKEYCKGVIHHACSYFDSITGCDECQVKVFKLRERFK